MAVQMILKKTFRTATIVSTAVKKATEQLAVSGKKGVREPVSAEGHSVLCLILELKSA